MLHEPMTSAQFDEALRREAGRRYRSRKRRERFSTLLVVAASLFVICAAVQEFGPAPLLAAAAVIVCLGLVLAFGVYR